MEEQNTYTENRRAADNLFILNYCIQKSQEYKRSLILISVDFAKAFDGYKQRNAKI